MGTGELNSPGEPCDGLASHPGGSRNTPSLLMLQKPGKLGPGGPQLAGMQTLPFKYTFALFASPLAASHCPDVRLSISYYYVENGRWSYSVERATLDISIFKHGSEAFGSKV